jgi:hypothetical protein
MAKKGHLTGSIKDRSQVQNPKTEKWVKRGPDGRFMSVKGDGTSYRNVRKEK